MGKAQGTLKNVNRHNFNQFHCIDIFLTTKYVMHFKESLHKFQYLFLGTLEMKRLHKNKDCWGFFVFVFVFPHQGHVMFCFEESKSSLSSDLFITESI